MQNHVRPEKEVHLSVRFESLDNLAVPDVEESRLTASTNELYISPSISDAVQENNQEVRKKPKNWLKKFANPKKLLLHENVIKKKEENGKKEKKFKLKSKIKVPVFSKT